MQRKFLLNFFFLVLINLLIKPFYIFFVDVGVQNTIGTAQYGLYFALFNFCYISQVVSDMGIQNYCHTHLSKNPSDIPSFLPKILGLKLALTLIFILFVMVASLVVGYSLTLIPILLLIAINQVLVSFTQFLRINFSAKGLYHYDSIFSVLDKLFLILILGFLLWGSVTHYRLNLTDFILAQTVGYALSLAIVAGYTYKILGKLTVSFSSIFNKALVRKSLPFALIIILMTAYSRIDAIMLERMLMDHGLQAGIYAAAYRIHDASNMFSFLVVGLLLPMYSAQLKNIEIIKDLARLSFGFLASGSLALLVIVWFWGSDLMDLLYHTPDAVYYAQILTVLMIGFVCIALSYIYGTLLTAANKLHGLNLLFAIGLFFNIVLNFFLIPRYEALGAAYATLVTQGLVLIGQILISNRECGVVLDYKPYLLGLLFLIISTLICWGIVKIGLMSWFVEMILSAMLCIVVSLLIGLIDWRKIIVLLGQNKER